MDNSQQSPPLLLSTQPLTGGSRPPEGSLSGHLRTSRGHGRRPGFPRIKPTGRLTAEALTRQHGGQVLEVGVNSGDHATSLSGGPVSVVTV